jgi:hypothetical protein
MRMLDSSPRLYRLDARTPYHPGIVRKMKNPKTIPRMAKNFCGFDNRWPDDATRAGSSGGGGGNPSTEPLLCLAWEETSAANPPAARTDSL